MNDGTFAAFEKLGETMTAAAPRRRGLRGYSRAFPLAGASRRYLLDKIPAKLWIAVRARAKREGVSMRALILQLLTTWVERP